LPRIKFNKVQIRVAEPLHVDAAPGKKKNVALASISIFGLVLCEKKSEF
jgi:hypothetical protein